jgi:hypothetical protein
MSLGTNSFAPSLSTLVDWFGESNASQAKGANKLLRAKCGLARSKTAGFQ